MLDRVKVNHKFMTVKWRASRCWTGCINVFCEAVTRGVGLTKENYREISKSLTIISTTQTLSTCISI